MAKKMRDHWRRTAERGLIGGGFGDSFWEAFRRMRAEVESTKYPNRGEWVPTDEVWDYREYDRTAPESLRTGGSPESMENVEDIADSMKRSGQHSPGHMLYDPNYVEMADEGLYGMHLGEGNHRAAAARALGRPYYLVEFARSNRTPNVVGRAPRGAERRATAKPNIRPDRFGYVPGTASAKDFEEFSEAIDASTGRGSPDDRAILKALGDKESAKRALKSMAKAGKIFGPAAGMIGLAAGLSDPAEALGMTVEKAGESNAWARKKMGKKAYNKMKREEAAYYRKKQAALEKRNPLARYGERGSARKKK